MKKVDIHKLMGEYLSGEINEKENSLVEKWIGESSDNAQEFKLHKQVWEETQIKFESSKSETVFKSILNKIDDQQGENIIPKRKPVLINIQPFIFIGKVAASLLLFGAIWYYATNFTPEQESKLIVKNIYKHNPAGQKSKIYLPDGSEVWLNAESEISFPEKFSPFNREVMLTGEAFFKVTKNPDQPFIVKTGNISTIVLGTSFNINAFKNNPIVKVALKSGKVRVEFEDNSSLKPFLLNPGEAMNYNKANDNVRKEFFDSESSLAWKEGVIVFKDAGFDKIVNTLKRWYGVQFDIKNRKNEAWLYTGSFDNATLENVLRNISYTKGFSYKITQKKVSINFN